MKITHIISDASGCSHFTETGIELTLADFAPPAPPLQVSAFQPARQWGLLVLPEGWDGRRHPAPARQLIICLSGRFDITVGDGHSRRFGPGDMVLMEDTHGQGHLTRVVGSDEVQCLCVKL